MTESTKLVLKGAGKPASQKTQRPTVRGGKILEGVINPPRYRDMSDGKYRNKDMRDHFETGEAKLRDFSNSDLSGANFSDMNLQGCIFKGANLEGTNFVGADLRWSDFTGADYSSAIFELLDENGNIISEANTFEARGIERWV